MKFKKVYKFSDNPSGIKRVRFENLRPGDLVYMEGVDGLEVDSNGKFIWLVLDEPVKISTPPIGNYGIICQPIA